MQQEEREKVKRSSIIPLNEKERRLKVDEDLKFVELQDKKMEKFVEQKEFFLSSLRIKYLSL